MIIATAVFAFYKFISSFIDLAKDRKHTRPIDSSVRMLELSQAIFAIFSLQAGLRHIFGTDEVWEHPLNLAVGCIVCQATAEKGIYMIRRANREIKNYRRENMENNFFGYSYSAQRRKEVEEIRKKYLPKGEDMAQKRFVQRSIDDLKDI